MKYANIIVDISLEKLDKTFQYLVPEELNETLRPGMQVVIPFGSRKITGYILELTDTPEFDPARMKPILSLSEKAVPIEAQLIELAVWMKETYGCTLNQALKTVLPSRRRVKSRASKEVPAALQNISLQPPKTLNEEQQAAVNGILSVSAQPCPFVRCDRRRQDRSVYGADRRDAGAGEADDSVDTGDFADVSESAPLL